MPLFLSRGLYGVRPRTHLDAHHMAPGWLFIEAGQWTLEVDYEPGLLLIVLPSFLLAVFGTSTFFILETILK